VYELVEAAMQSIVRAVVGCWFLRLARGLEIESVQRYSEDESALAKLALSLLRLSSADIRPSHNPEGRGVQRILPAVAKARLSRANFLSSTALAAGALTMPFQANAAPLSAADAEVTDKVRIEWVDREQLNKQFGQDGRGYELTIGLFGNNAPESVEIFKALCGAGLNVPCMPKKEYEKEFSEDDVLRRLTWKACLRAGPIPVTYEDSLSWQVREGKRLRFGKMPEGDKLIGLRMPPFTPRTESAGISHDSGGLLSVKKGGGEWLFQITTGPMPELDEKYIVIGRVIDGFDDLKALDKHNTRGPWIDQGLFGDIDEPKACEYSNPVGSWGCTAWAPVPQILWKRATIL
jgi:cyclophilin family peptidyl-prolyl cis-trans isomerase